MLHTVETALSRSLVPICTRDDHHMRYEAKGLTWKPIPRGRVVEALASYHCNFEGCSVRYDPANGYYTVVLTPDQPFFIEEPGVNLRQCPRHHAWLYRAETGNDASPYNWRCGVEGCDYVHDGRPGAPEE